MEAAQGKQPKTAELASKPDSKLTFQSKFNDAEYKRWSEIIQLSQKSK